MFKLELGTNSTAFDNAPSVEIARILRLAAELIDAGAIGGTLHDLNGYRVGQFERTET